MDGFMYLLILAIILGVIYFLIKQDQEKFKTRISQEMGRLVQALSEQVPDRMDLKIDNKFKNFFDSVKRSLDGVHQGLGKVDKMSESLSNFEKTLSNVKSRGVLGEVQLENLLEDTMDSSRFIKNAKIKEGFVEFAIRLPGKEDKEVLIPIDAKFPQEDYIRLQEAFEKSDKLKVEECRKALKKGIESEAKKISQKYINPPQTTPFAVLFLPIEGLYLEILREEGSLIHDIHRKYQVLISSPVMLTSLINSLNVGFSTLRIKKESGKIAEILFSVKNEFGKFLGSVETIEKQNTTVANSIEGLKRRFKVLDKKLSETEKLEVSEKNKLKGEQS